MHVIISLFTMNDPPTGVHVEEIIMPVLRPDLHRMPTTKLALLQMDHKDINLLLTTPLHLHRKSVI